jgi:putative transposase
MRRELRGRANRSEKEWKMGPREWVIAKAQFAVIFGERFTKAMAA